MAWWRRPTLRPGRRIPRDRKSRGSCERCRVLHIDLQVLRPNLDTGATPADACVTASDSKVTTPGHPSISDRRWAVTLVPTAPQTRPSSTMNIRELIDRHPVVTLDRQELTFTAQHAPEAGAEAFSQHGVSTDVSAGLGGHGPSPPGPPQPEPDECNQIRR
jgi:hypothetical protein